MSKFQKNAVSIVLTVATAVWLSGAAVIAPVGAQTAADLQAQIDTLLAQIAQLQTQLTTTTGSTTSVAASCSFTRSLYPEMTGSDVKCLQEYLNAAGHTVATTGAGSVGNETEYYGSLTKAAVLKWQIANGVSYGSYGGYFGPVSRAKYTELAASAPSTTTTTTTTTTVPTTGTTTVALSSNNPAAATIISDTSIVMQNSAPILEITVSNGKATDVNVNTIRLTRTGIAADADINNLYLYDGGTKVAEMSSASTKVFTFNSSSGLFTVPANSTKTILVGINVAANVATAKTIGLSIVSASDIVLSDASTVGGTFPINGNQMVVASVTDLGYINLTNTTTFPATIDPSSTSQELWRFTATANSQKMQIKKIVLTMVGTISTGDIQNLKLTVSGVQVGSTVQIDSSNKVTFDLSSSPYEILSGQNRIFVLNGEVIKGTGRAFKFTIRSTADFVSYDTNYAVDTTPLSAGAALTVVDPDSSGDGTNINNGTLTISRSADSPSGNVAAGMTDQSLARFDYKANGEDIKVSYVRVTVDEESSDQNIDNGKLYYNGSQVGVTNVSVLDEGTVATDAGALYSLGNTVVIPAGTTGVFEYRADTTQGGGTALAANQTLQVTLIAGTTDAVGQTSLTNISTSAASGHLITVKTGALSISKNASVADATTVNPTGVVGAVGVRVGSFILSAGSGEPVNVTQIVVGDEPADPTSNFGANFQNLTLKHEGVAIAPTQGTLSSTAGIDYTFSLSPSIQIPAGGQYVVDIYADILTGASDYAAAEAGLEFVSASATGANTSTDATTGLAVTDLHNVVLSANGSLTIIANASTPVAGQLVMGETDQTFAILSFTAGSEEDVDVSVITITDTGSFGGSLSNIKLYDGSTLLGTVASLDSQTNGVATFNLASNWTIPKNTTKVLTVKASINAYGAAVSGGSHTINLANAANVTTRGSQSGVAIGETVSGATGTAQTVYRTRAVASKGSSSPSGAAVVGANSNVLEFNIAASPYYDVVVNAVAITVSGSLTTTSTGNANLYKSTDLVTALATETYVQDLVSVSAAVTGQSLAVTGSSGDWDGIPMGATVLVNDTSVSATAVLRAEVTAITATVLTCTVVGDISTYAGIDVGVTYRPMQPGVGKLYFGAQSTITRGNAAADAVTTGDTTLTVTSTDGFAVGDTVVVKGYSSSGVEITSSAGGVIATIPSSTSMTVSAVTLADTIVTNYLSGTAANAITNSQNSLAIVYTGLINTTGQVVGAGNTMTFVVKGDTTSTGTSGTTANLRADIAAVGDLNWDDYTNYGVITVTKNIPVTGGTLTYTY